MKKVLATMFLAAALIFVGAQDNTAEAYRVHMGYYSDGNAVYLLTETIAGSRSNFSCDVVAGYSRLHYNFYYRNGSPYYRNNEGYAAYVFGGQSPVAANIWNFVQRY